ncbi:Fluoroacetate dehalogenase [Sporomusa rhizae]|uniref:alpha/beta fold hydrolase n=1 Tax=Sporomusa rhizae TaxID=357999 RepID=UPI00352B6F01
MCRYLDGFEQMMVDTGDSLIKVARAGHGEPMLMLHGFPETHLMWHKIAPALTEKYTVVLTDLRGYGESSHPQGLPDHSNYSKKTMSTDQARVMEKLGYSSYYLVGHDRGARVAYRMLLDYQENIKKCMLLDIIPGYDMYNRTDKDFAIAYYHWFFLAQQKGLPERILAVNREIFIRLFWVSIMTLRKVNKFFRKQSKPNL